MILNNLNNIPYKYIIMMNLEEIERIIAKHKKEFMRNIKLRR